MSTNERDMNLSSVSMETGPRAPGGKPAGERISLECSSRAGGSRQLSAPGLKPSRPRLPSTGLSSAGTAELSAARRRSSTRSIKRKKFDDEIVESGLAPGQPPAFRLRAPSVDLQVSLASSGVNEPLRRRGGRAVRRNRRPRAAPAALKDMGRWKPTDDLALILSAQQTCDLTLVHLGVQFSCRFTLQEVQERWYALLFDPAISRLATAAMRALHPEQISDVERRTLYSPAEEQLLKAIGSDAPPSAEQLQLLLDASPHVFHASRSAHRLRQYWDQLKQYQLLQDQAPARPLLDGHQLASFSDAEETIDDRTLMTQPPDPPQLTQQRAHEQLLAKREIGGLEAEARSWQVMVDAVTGVSPPEFDNGTLAILRGRTVRYLMRSAEVTMGRGTADSPVDIDLSLEGPAAKVCRRQAVIKLQNCGEFVLVNVGRRVIYVDGRPVLSGSKGKLHDKSVLDIAYLRFTFVVHHDLVKTVRDKQASANTTPA